MRRAWMLAAAMLVGCGGGGVGSEPQAGVVVVTYGNAGQYAGLTTFGDGPTRIVLAEWLRDFPDVRYRAYILRHELWHAMTGIQVHAEDETCVSSDYVNPYDFPVIETPCEVERAQVLASPYTPIIVRFDEATDELYNAAQFWNLGVNDLVVMMDGH